MPIIFICVVIFMLWFTYERTKVSKLRAKQSESFWDREEEANHTRNKDISGLDYLYIEESQIPEVQTNNTDIKNTREMVLSFLQNKMIDLSDYSNTELRLAFGVGHFTELSSYDANYTNFLTALSTYSKILYEEKFFQAANECYLLLLKIGSNRSADYYGLAETFLALDQPGELADLISHVSESDIPRKDKIIAKLKEILVTYQ